MSSTPPCWDRLPTPGSLLLALTDRPHRAVAPSCLSTKVRHSSDCRQPGSGQFWNGAAFRRG
eukprot:2931265-Alexandrium_andersonii.AAC.1